MDVSSLIALVLVLGTLAALAWGLFRLLKPARGALMVCTTCGHCGPAATKTPGSFGVEVILWLLFLLPGMIYSIWRLLGRKQVCASCDSATLMLADSPVGRRMLREASSPAK